MIGDRAFTPVRKLENVRGGDTDTIFISDNFLPGEFNLEIQWDGTGNDTSNYYNKRYLIASAQDIELWINPQYGDDRDSIWFQDDERENNAFDRFAIEDNDKRKELSSIYESLLELDSLDTKLRKTRFREYRKRRNTYNRWINNHIRDNRELFFSQVLEFRKIPESELEWSLSGRMHNRSNTFLNEIDFSNPEIIRTAGLERWMDEYIKLSVREAISSEKRDSLLIDVGIDAIEKVKSENKIIYGWMADYFYKVYEKSGNMKGIIKLNPYLDDLECMTENKRLIHQRSATVENITPGKQAPDFHFINDKEEHFSLYEYKTNSDYKLILFWNTGCMNCIAITKLMHLWYLEQPPEERPAVFAINLDEYYEKEVWEKRISLMPEWEHMIDKGGADSEVANAYG
ncbi:MAG: redoxin domain-containing protein, partial [Bacteroidales bacterium]|nr:redoxin domain-containing protein [Bacteroidales bacterium]